MGSPARAGVVLAERGDGLEGVAADVTAVSAAPARRPRVALLGPAYPYRGGMSQFLTRVHLALAEKTSVAHYSFRRQYPSFLFPGKSQLDSSEEPLRVPAEPVLDALAPWSWPATARRVLASRPDAVVYNWWLPFFGPAFAGVLGPARKAGAVSVMIAHNLTPHEKRPLDEWLTRTVLGVTDAYLVVSSPVEQDLLRRVPGALYARVLHPVYSQYASSVSREDARAALGWEGDVLLFFGLVRPYKGLDTLLEALPLVLARRSVSLVVAGEFYEPIEDYEARARRLGVADRVRFLGRYIPDEEARLLFAAADVCVLPYRSATQSGVIQAAYGAGCPVITTRVGGLPEFVAEGKSGFTVEPENPRQLADAVLRFFDLGGRAAMEPGVREHARSFSWEALADALLDLIAKARERRR